MFDHLSEIVKKLEPFDLELINELENNHPFHQTMLSYQPLFYFIIEQMMIYIHLE